MVVFSAFSSLFFLLCISLCVGVSVWQPTPPEAPKNCHINFNRLRGPEAQSDLFWPISRVNLSGGLQSVFNSLYHQSRSFSRFGLFHPGLIVFWKAQHSVFLAIGETLEKQAFPHGDSFLMFYFLPLCLCPSFSPPSTFLGRLDYAWPCPLPERLYIWLQRVKAKSNISLSL